MEQEIRFCTSPDGTTIAWAKHGSGPPLVKAGNWLTHLEFDWQSPVWRHWMEGLGERHTLIRYDERGCGLSDRDPKDLGIDAWVADLETVVDAAGVDRFTLIGVSAAAAIAVAYAARHPERVEGLIAYGGFARGRAHRGEDARRRMEMLISVIGNGWTSPDPAFRRMFTMMFLPEGTPEQMAWYDELQRRSITPNDAVRLYQARGVLDVRDLAPQMRAKALVLHGTGDRVAPFEEGRLLASLLPNARLVPLESVNHVLLEAEPAWSEFLAEVNAFTGTTDTAPSSPEELPELSNRELDVLSCVALGLDNDEIAARLYISVRTVERHISNIYVKFGVSGKAARAAAAARFARHAG